MIDKRLNYFFLIRSEKSFHSLSTRNPLVALFFATIDFDKKNDGAVYILDKHFTIKL